MKKKKKNYTIFLSLRSLKKSAKFNIDFQMFSKTFLK